MKRQGKTTSAHERGGGEVEVGMDRHDGEEEKNINKR